MASQAEISRADHPVVAVIVADAAVWRGLAVATLARLALVNGAPLAVIAVGIGAAASLARRFVNAAMRLAGVHRARHPVVAL